jgi:hypothetical protein
MVSQGGEMANTEDSALVKEKPYVKYDQLIARAEVEGRINGRYRCLVCGMKYHLKEEAEDCCRIAS